MKAITFWAVGIGTAISWLFPTPHGSFFAGATIGIVFLVGWLILAFRRHHS